MEERIQGRDGSLKTAAEIAMWLGVSRAYVYENAVRLGAIRLGNGPRARLRFDQEIVASRLSNSDTTRPTPSRKTQTRTKRKRQTRSSVPLLPIANIGR